MKKLKKKPVKPVAKSAKKAASTSAPFNLTVAQDVYVKQVLNLIHIVNELRGGQSARLIETIEKSLPAWLEQMTAFKESNIKTATFYLAGLLLKQSKTQVSEKVAKKLKVAIDAHPTVLSQECFALLSSCSCVPYPWSLRPVDSTKLDPMGFKYIIDSNCGHKPWKWWEPCGEPVTGLACSM